MQLISLHVHIDYVQDGWQPHYAIGLQSLPRGADFKAHLHPAPQQRRPRPPP